MNKAARDIVFSAFLFACLLLGGASREGFPSNYLLQVLGAGFVCWGLYHLKWRGLSRFERLLLLLAGLGLAIVIVQFLPLPTAVWRDLPGRASIAAELQMLDALPDPGFVSLSIHESLASVVWLLPAAGLALAVLAARKLPDLAIAFTIIAGALLSIAVGVAQFLGGSEAPWYFYDFTNRGFMVGFFANANHMATLLLVSLPFIAALVREGRERMPKHRQEFTVLGLALFGFVVIGVGLVGSGTGYALLAPVTLASALIVWTPSRRVAAALVVPVLIVSGALITLIGGSDNVFASEASASIDGREEIGETITPAALAFFPVGSGLGTFEEIYRRYEDPDTVSTTFIAHAHNDYLELVLELGAAGAALIILFLLWWLYGLARLVRAGDAPFGWAGWIAVGVILTHSAWDYPLRTAALSAVFAVSCVLLARSVSTRGWATRITEAH
ncbi:MAG: O-antigen ligase family protein [Porphyrobacter sp.]|nr:O-antigen ligase family protein [Porphyrobacter sp.]